MIEEFIKTLQQDEQDAEGIVARGQEKAKAARAQAQETVQALRKAVGQATAQKIRDMTAVQEKARQELKRASDRKFAGEMEVLQRSALSHRPAVIKSLIDRILGN